MKLPRNGSNMQPTLKLVECYCNKPNTKGNDCSIFKAKHIIVFCMLLVNNK